MPRAPKASGSSVQASTAPTLSLDAIKTGKQYMVKLDPKAEARSAIVQDKRQTQLGLPQVYLSFLDEDKRMDRWAGLEVVVGPYEVPPPVTNTVLRVLGLDESATTTSAIPTASTSIEGGAGVIGDGAGDKRSPSSKRRKLSSGQAAPAVPHGNGAEAITNSTAHSDSAKRSHVPQVAASTTTPSRPSSPEREHAAMTRIRNFESARWGEYLLETWYFSPYPFVLDDPPLDPAAPAAASKTGGLSTSASSSSLAVPAATNSHPNRKHGRSSLPAPSSSSNGHVLGTPAGTGDAVMTLGKGKDKERHKSGLATMSVTEMFSGGGSKQSQVRKVGGRLYVCDLCFNYTRKLDAWRLHSDHCSLFSPPGRMVYQRSDSEYTIWEVDGAQASLYCQNISLFGKLFIDHKSVFFHVENFLFYIVCYNSTSYRHQPMAFFSKEKNSYDDYNLACIVTFPPYQRRQTGNLLIEFSYLLTRHPATRPLSLSPGTPERPISDLGMKGYKAYWISVVLRYLRDEVKRIRRMIPQPAPPVQGSSGRHGVSGEHGAGSSRSKSRSTSRSGLRGTGRPIEEPDDGDASDAAGGSDSKSVMLNITLGELAKGAHLKVDDTWYTLELLGLVRRRTRTEVPYPAVEAGVNTRDMNGTTESVTFAMDEGSTSEQLPSLGSHGTNMSNGNGASSLTDQGGAYRNGNKEDDACSGDEREMPVTVSDTLDQASSEWEVVITSNTVDELLLKYRVKPSPQLVESAVLL